MEITDLQSKLQKIEGELPSYIKGAIKQLPVLMQGYIGQEMEFRGQGRNAVAFAPSSSTKLQLGTGALFRSFLPKDKNNRYVETPTGYTNESLLPYATIQDEGGFIKTKGKMEGYFWHRFKETKSPYYRSLALHVRKVGGVTIKARPYFKAAEKRLSDEGIPQFQQMILDRVIAILSQ